MSGMRTRKALPYRYCKSCLLAHVLTKYRQADLEWFLALEHDRGTASDAQHIMNKAVFDATAEALLVELTPVRTSWHRQHEQAAPAVSPLHALIL